ncbi:hypothetical protein BHE74_00055242, partial [Ensete ventricosum]
ASYSQKDALALSLPPSASSSPLPLHRRQGWPRAVAPCGLVAGDRPPCRHTAGWPLAVATCARHLAACPFAGTVLQAAAALVSWPQPVVPAGAAGRPCIGVGRGWPPILLAAFAMKTQQEHVERFYAIQSHHTQFKTNLSHENLGSNTTVGKPQQIRMEKMKEVKRPPL